MRTFELHRDTDETGISGVGYIADGVEFDDGYVVLRWRTATKSTGVYDSIEACEKIHGHAGKTRIVWTSDAYRRARIDCIQDACENAPFACIGGLGKRASPIVPEWISKGDEKEWLRGYEDTARGMYGDEWRTAQFGWTPALTLGGVEQASTHTDLTALPTEKK